MKAALLLILWFLFCGGSEASAQNLDGLPRRNPRPIEAHAGIDTRYGALRVSGGYRVRTIVTVPGGAHGPLPAMLFIQWLSCDSVEIDPHDHSGWSGVIRGLVETPGFVVARTEKPGVGDSEGPACDALDYETELAVHRQALERLIHDPAVDPRRIYLVGMSMGSNMAPLLAAAHPVAGVIIWGGGTRTWFERQLAFERRAMELGGFAPAGFRDRMRGIARFYTRYLLEGRDPMEIERADPDLRGIWGHWLVGTEGITQYGRPLAFHRQAQQQDWAGAWGRVSASVLILKGGYDWYEDLGSAQLVADIVNSHAPGRARLEVLPGIDHHFVRYASAEAAFRESGGQPDPAPAVAAIRDFLAGR